MIFFLQNWTALHYGARCISPSSPEKVLVLLRDGRADPNSRDRSGMTPAHTASHEVPLSKRTLRWEDLIVNLVLFGARLDLPCAQGFTASDLIEMGCSVEMTIDEVAQRIKVAVKLRDGDIQSGELPIDPTAYDFSRGRRKYPIPVSHNPALPSNGKLHNVLYLAQPHPQNFIYQPSFSLYMERNPSLIEVFSCDCAKSASCEITRCTSCLAHSINNRALAAGVGNAALGDRYRSASNTPQQCYTIRCLTDIEQSQGRIGLFDYTADGRLR